MTDRLDSARLRLCTDTDALERAVPGWDHLTSSLPSPMQQLAWLRAATALPDLRLHGLALDDGSAVAPLEWRRGRLEVATVVQLYEPVDLLWQNDDSLGRLGDALAHIRAPLLLRRVPAGSPAVRILKAAFHRRAVVAIHRQPGLPVLELAGLVEEPESLLNSGRRSDLRRARRLAEQRGEVDVEVVSPSPADVGELLDIALRVEAHSWKGRSGTALAQDSVRLPFYRRYALELSQTGSLRIAFLRVDGRPIAMQLAVEHANRLWLLKIGYDQEYGRCSPGQLLMLEVVRRAAEGGLETIEFLGSRAPWTETWTRHERPCVAAAFYPLRAGSTLPLARDAGRLLGKQASPRIGLERVRGRVLRRAAQRYVAGPELSDALALVDVLDQPTTLAFWNGPDDSARLVAAEHMRAIGAIAAGRLDSYPSIKLPALAGDHKASEAVAEQAAEAGVLLHFDSLAENEADRTLALACRLAARGGDVGATLPGCWSRSVRDAQLLGDAGVRVRIVKGQWPGDRDPRDGFLAVVAAVERANGRVAVATHDAGLAHAALTHLPGAELELLLGLPMTAVALVAAEQGAPVRVYVPYGRGYLPYAVRRTVRKPVALWWLARDLALRR